MFENTVERIKRALHPGGREIHFDPDPHHYLLDGERLPSVTTLIKGSFPEFDANAAAARKAAREGLAVEEVLAAWAKRRDEASLFGTKIHSMAELMILKQDFAAADHMAESEREKNYLVALRAALIRIGKFYDFIECEKIVFSPELKIAGTIDLLLRNKQTGAYVVADWKTNREIKQQAYREEVGHGVCATLPNCNFIHYSLQLGAYRDILAVENYVDPAVELGAILIHLQTGPGGVRCEFVRPRELLAEARQLIRHPRPAELTL